MGSWAGSSGVWDGRTRTSTDEHGQTGEGAWYFAKPSTPTPFHSVSRCFTLFPFSFPPESHIISAAGPRRSDPVHPRERQAACRTSRLAEKEQDTYPKMQPEPRNSPEDITGDSLLPLLKTTAIGRKMYAFSRCESTSVFARRLLEGRGPTAGAPLQALHGTLVVADYQTAGRGRNANTWAAGPGNSLLFSVILDPASCGGDPAIDTSADGPAPNTAAPRGATLPQDPGESNRTTLASAVAVVQALHKMGASQCTIKWPNDVLAPDGRKLCGILTERVARRGSSPALIVGIGINVNQTEQDFPEDLRLDAASLRQVLGRPASRLLLLKDVLEDLERCLTLPSQALFTKWRRHCSTLDRNVVVRTAAGEVFGQAIGLESDGSLVLRLETGRLQTVHSGDIRELRSRL